MSNRKKEYDELIKQKKIIIDEIKTLEENEFVMRYLELKKQNEDLWSQQQNLYTAVLKEKFMSCKHILVCSRIDYDDEGHRFKSRGCIKCGLDNSVLDENYMGGIEAIMYSYLRENVFSLSGPEPEIECDLDLAQAIYSKIKEAHPNIDDKMATKYFEIALDNIRNIEVSNDRKISRAKRLSLNPDFKRWNDCDIRND